MKDSTQPEVTFERALLRLVRCQYHHPERVLDPKNLPNLLDRNGRCIQRATYATVSWDWQAELFAACDDHVLQCVNEAQVFERVRDLKQVEGMRLPDMEVPLDEALKYDQGSV